MLIRTDIILEANKAFRVAAGGTLIAQFRITRQILTDAKQVFPVQGNVIKLQVI